MPAVLVLWAAFLGLGWMVLADYANRPGPLHEVVRAQPLLPASVSASATPTLIVALHPHCPCSRASLRMLEPLLHRYPQAARLLVAAYEPAHAPTDWDEGGLFDAAQRLPGAMLIPDVEGAWLRELGVLTSGHVLLYDAHGELRFSGGITAGRGHEGANPAFSALEDRLSAPTTHPLVETPVFGCFIHTEPSV
ncbi:MAG: RedB protein [Bacteroidota bacterium]